jgi:phosphohistidine phosphatase SixA
MKKDFTTLKRRPLFLPLLAPIVALLLAIGAAAWFFDARTSTVVMIVRHAESEPSTPEGDPVLSVEGKERAARLARVLSQAKPQRGVDAIFASDLQRTQQTVTPLAEALGLPVNVVPSARWNKLADQIRREHRGEFVVVSATTVMIPQLIEELSGELVAVGENEYDPLFVVFLPQLSKAKVLKLRY